MIILFKDISDNIVILTEILLTILSDTTIEY